MVDKRKYMRPKQSTHKRVETVGYKWETSEKTCGQSTHSVAGTGRNASPETNVKSCGPVMHPFQRSKNPSQVDLFGEL